MLDCLPLLEAAAAAEGPALAAARAARGCCWAGCARPLDTSGASTTRRSTGRLEGGAPPAALWGAAAGAATAASACSLGRPPLPSLPCSDIKPRTWGRATAEAPEATAGTPTASGAAWVETAAAAAAAAAAVDVPTGAVAAAADLASTAACSCCSSSSPLSLASSGGRSALARVKGLASASA